MKKVLSLNSKFISNSILYITGSMITPAIGLIMLPIYTNYLEPSEYGVLTTVQTLVGMFQLFLLLSLHGAVTRFYYDYLDDKIKQKQYLGSIFTFVLFFSTIVVLFLFILQKPIGNVLFSNISINPFYYYLLAISWASSLFALPLALWRAQEKAGLFVSVNIIKSILIMAVSAYLIIIKGTGAEGPLLSQMIISIIFVIISFISCKNMLSINLNKEYIKSSLIFSLPLLPHVASGWIIKSSDRVILEKFVDLSEIGLYSLGVQVATVLALFYTGVNNALVPRYTKLRKEGNIYGANKLLKIFGLIIFVFGLLSIPVAMIGLNLIISPEYKGALSFIPILIIAEIIKGFYFIPVARLFYIKSTKSIAKSSIVAAIVNIAFNIILIPYFGAYGSAIATIIAEFIRFSLIYMSSRKDKVVYSI